MKTKLLATLLLTATASALAPQDTLVIQIGSDIPSIDPGVAYDAASGLIVENLYEPLLTYKGSNLKELTPLLATRWAVTPDGKQYTFTLRQGVKFHSGNPFRCADAEYTLRRNLVTNSGQSGNWFLSESLLGTADNAKDNASITWEKISQAVQCDQKGQLVLKLPKLDPTLLVKLAFMGQGIVDKAWAVNLGEWSGTEKDWKAWVGKDLSSSQLSAKPSGTGAYRLLRRDADALLAEAFDGYWGGKPKIAKVIVQKVLEASSRQAAFLKGDADVIDGESTASDELNFKGKPGVTWIEGLPNLNVPVIFMNEAIKGQPVIGSGKLDGKGIPANFFSDLNVRKAFSYAFNYAQYINDVQKGKGLMRTMLLPDQLLGYDEQIPTYKYDPAQAKAFFQKAWQGQLWDKGFEFTAYYSDNTKTAQTALEIIKKEVEALNPKFRINVQNKPWSELLSENKKGLLAMTVGTWIPDYADPDNYMYTFYNSNGYYFPRSGWKNEEADKLTEQARQTNDSKVREQLYAKVGAIGHAEAPYIIMPAAYNYTFFRDTINGASKANYNPIRSFGLGVFWRELAKK